MTEKQSNAGSTQPDGATKAAAPGGGRGGRGPGQRGHAPGMGPVFGKEAFKADIWRTFVLLGLGTAGVLGMLKGGIESASRQGNRHAISEMQTMLDELDR